MEWEDILLVFLGTFIVVGYGYSMDMPQALEQPLRGAPYNLNSIEFNILYFATFLPILITDIPLGVIIDKFPMQKTVIVIALSSFIAELLTAVLFDFRPDGYIYMVYGLRAIVGMAGSSAFTMQGFVMARYAAQHFEMLMGFGLCVPYIFDALNATITPIIYDSTLSISLPWYIASGMDFLAVIAALLISRIITNKQKRKRDEIQQRLIQSGQQKEAQEQEQFSIQYLWQMPRLFWIINLAIFANQISMGIYSNLNDLILNRFQLSYVTTGELLLIPFVFGSILALIFGRILITRSYNRRFTIVFSSVMIFIGFVIIYILPNNRSSEEVSAFDYFAIIIFLFLFSVLAGTLYTVLCSSVSLLADKKRLGTAWGVIGTAIGLGESVSPVLNGLIQDDSNLPDSYKTLTLVYTLLSIVPIGFALFIYFGPYSVIDSSFGEAQNRKQLQNAKMGEDRQSIVTSESN